MDIVSNDMRSKPGPGAYDSPQRFGQDAPSVTIRGRPEDNIRSLSPGPGNYDHSQQAIKDKVISYKMSASKRQDIVNKSAS